MKTPRVVRMFSNKEKIFCCIIFVTIFETSQFKNIDENVGVTSSPNMTVVHRLPFNIRMESNEIETIRATRYPCNCNAGQCGCCTGFLLDQFNQKGCLNITYEPEDFAFKMALSFNNRVLYKNKISGKNPPPACIRVPRLRQLRFCVKFSNLYFAGRNMHVCLDAEIDWDNFQLFQMNFDCVRIGANGVAVVPPEEGGGVANISDEDDDDDIEEDYDDNA